MGQFRLEITAVGNHGCERQVGDQGTVYGCRRMGCVDCQTREFVERLKAQGCSVEQAKLTHWPGTESEVADDLITRRRHGTFPEHPSRKAS